MNANTRAYRTILPSLGQRCYIDPDAVVIGKVELADDVSVWPLTVIRGDVNHIHIGARSNIQDGTVIHVSRPSPEQPGGYPTTIGEDVTIAHKVMLHGCTIGNRVMVGMGAIVLDGAIIEDEVIVGAGALVTPGKTLASGYLYTGSPAKAARPLREGELDHVLENGANYVALKDDYLQAE
jgi:carbonic anhydrase/acetyltransferase-like protein (isoleucine patch superfamily)